MILEGRTFIMKAYFLLCLKWTLFIYLSMLFVCLLNNKSVVFIFRFNTRGELFENKLNHDGLFELKIMLLRFFTLPTYIPAIVIKDSKTPMQVGELKNSY